MSELVALLERVPWEKLGIVSVLSAVAIGFARGWIVPGSVHDRMVTQLTRERDEQTELARGAIETAKTLTDYFRGRGTDRRGSDRA